MDCCLTAPSHYLDQSLWVYGICLSAISQVALKIIIPRITLKSCIWHHNHVSHMATSHYLSLWAISDDELNWPPRIYLVKYKEKYCHTTLQNFQELYTSLYIFSLPALLHSVQVFIFFLTILRAGILVYWWVGVERCESIANALELLFSPCLSMYPLHAYVWKLEFNHNKEYRTIHLSNI